jgi:hypothetical protein
MANDGTKSKAGPRRKQESVLGSLPTTRPERLGRPRRDGAAARAKPRAARTDPKPAAVTAGCPPLERPKTAQPPPPRPIGAPSGTELVTTAIQATGELARIGLTVGGQMLKRAVDRLPRP